MKRLLVLVLIMSLLLIPTTAFATQPSDASGTLYSDGSIGGTFEGTYVAIPGNGGTYRVTVDGSVTDQSGVVHTGTILFHLNAKHWVILKGTGELANLHGQGTYTFPSEDGTPGNYKGKIHFDSR